MLVPYSYFCCFFDLFWRKFVKAEIKKKSILVLFFAFFMFFVLNTEFFDTSPPSHALHIWNAQDLYFHKKWVNRSVFTDKIGVLTTFVYKNLKIQFGSIFVLFFVKKSKIIMTPCLLLFTPLCRGHFLMHYFKSP
jgi:hypothetical protein